MDMDRFGSVNITILVGALARQGSIRMELAVAINRAVERNLQTFSPDNVCKYAAWHTTRVCSAKLYFNRIGVLVLWPCLVL